MPTNVTFTSLTADIQNYLERGGSSTTDPTVYAQIPRLTNAAERKLAQMLKLLGQIEVMVDSTGLGPNSFIIPKPDRWRQTVSMNYGAGTNLNVRTPLLPRSYEYCRTYWPDDTQTSPPKFYADYGYNNWIIVPTPDQIYPLEISSYMLPPLLDANNQANFWTIYCPNALLYATLLEASTFVKDDTRIQVWDTLFKQEMASLNGMDLQRIIDRSSERRSV